MVPATPSPERSRGFLFGISSHPQRQTREDQAREAAATALCGGKVLREDISWQRIQPKEGVWDFEQLDYAVKTITGQGLEPELIYAYTPRWAIAKDWIPLDPKRNHYYSSRPDYGAWREFVRRVAERYRGRVRFFEVWNEPDLYSFANFSAEEYLNLLEIAARETRKVNPEALIMTGGYTCMPPYFALNDQKHQEKILSGGERIL
ncbi:hypothetical protein SDC9_125996 [bioreactor metagenome]|uniref:Glycosyl hydrolases family 39 N-terminal catalytic domain-containing protein n=1 Tax=bioreactor metagenome TaxID=1076179 RepID=A0A645CQ00_9ZZZZ